MFKKFLAAILAFLLIFVSTTLVFATGNDSGLLSDNNYEIGDVNTDGEIDINDVTAIQKHLAKFITLDSYQFQLADVNYDGRVSIKDATYIQMQIVKLIDPIQPTEPTTEKDNDKPIELPFVPAV